jgi:hypothetical protein
MIALWQFPSLERLEAMARDDFTVCHWGQRVVMAMNKASLPISQPCLMSKIRVQSSHGKNHDFYPFLIGMFGGSSHFVTSL